MLNKNRLLDIFTLGVIGLGMLLLLIFPNKMSIGIADGLMICGNILIPSLFPFTVLSVFLFECGIIQKRIQSSFSFAFVIFILSALGGYPIGAKIIADAHNNGYINKETANRTLRFCVNAGPAFILTVVGKGIFSNEKIGIILLVAHLISSLEILLFNGRYLLRENIKCNKQKTSTLAQSFVTSVASACSSMIGISSYVILFSGIINLLQSLEKRSTFVVGLLEITNGVLKNKNIYLITFFLGFSGFCIIMQILSIGANFIDKPYKLITSRIAHGLLSVVNLKLLLLLFPICAQTITNNTTFNYRAVTNNTLGGLLLILLAITFISTLNNKKYCGKIIKDIW